MARAAACRRTAGGTHQGEHARERPPQVEPLHDGVQHAVREQELGPLESDRQLLAQGLRQLMAGNRKFALSHITRDDICALTPHAAEVSGVPYVMEVDGDGELTDPELIAKAKALTDGEAAPPAPEPAIETPVDLSTGKVVAKPKKK